MNVVQKKRRKQNEITFKQLKWDSINTSYKGWFAIICFRTSSFSFSSSLPSTSFLLPCSLPSISLSLISFSLSLPISISDSSLYVLYMHIYVPTESQSYWTQTNKHYVYSNSSQIKKGLLYYIMVIDQLVQAKWWSVVVKKYLPFGFFWFFMLL